MKTKLQVLQQKIDKCNNKLGCNANCSKSNQANCEKLKAHTERMQYCIDLKLPIEVW